MQIFARLEILRFKITRLDETLVMGVIFSNVQSCLLNLLIYFSLNTDRILRMLDLTLLPKSKQTSELSQKRGFNGSTGVIGDANSEYDIVNNMS